MKIYRMPKDVRTVIFDIDGTLYTDSFYVEEQVDVQIRHFAAIRSLSEDEARKMMRDYRAEWSLKHGGKKISLGNAFKNFGISIQESIAWRNALLSPEKYLKKDAQLKRVLHCLSKEKHLFLVCVTNNPVLAARKTLEAIGVSEELPYIIGLDTCFESKPSEAMLKKAAELSGSSYTGCISVGDRYDIDLSLPLSLGMGAIEVSGVEDVYALANIL